MANTLLRLDASVAVDGDGSIGAPLKYIESANALMTNSTTLLVDRNTEVVMTTGFTNNSIGVSGARPRIASADKNLGWAEAPGAHISGPSSIVYALDVYNSWDVVGLEISGTQYGVGTSNQAGLYMTECYVHDVTTRGVQCAALSTVEYNTFEDCPIGVNATNNTNIEHNHFKDCPVGVVAYQGSVTWNLFENCSTYCIGLAQNSTSVSHNAFYDSPIGVWDFGAARAGILIFENAFQGITILASLATTVFTFNDNIYFTNTTPYLGNPIISERNVSATKSPFVNAVAGDFSIAEDSELRAISTVVGSSCCATTTRNFLTAGFGPSQAAGGSSKTRLRRFGI